MGFLDKLFQKRRSPYEGENAALVQAMDAVAVADNAENRKKMYEVLLTSRLLIPTPEIPAEARSMQSRQLYWKTEKFSLELYSITDKLGRKLIPVFTDIEALRNWDPNTPVLENPVTSKFFKFLLMKYCVTPGVVIEGVVINPFDPIRQMIRPMAIIASGEFEVLARGAIPDYQEAGLIGHQLPNPSLRIQPPNQTLPPAAVETLSNSAGGFPEIANIYVFSIVLDEGLPPQLTLGLELDGAVTKEREQLIIQSLWRTIVGWSNAYKQTDIDKLDFAVLTGKMAAAAKNWGTKIYQRC